MNFLLCCWSRAHLGNAAFFGAGRARCGIGAMFLATLLPMLLLTTGCLTPAGPIAGGAGVSHSPLPIDDARAQRVWASYRDATRERHALRGSARVALSGPDFKLNRPQNIAAKRPANLRFEIVGLFDQLAAVLATNGREYSFYEAGQPGVERGILAPGLLWSLAKIDLDPEELVGLLLGTPLPSPGIARAAVWLEPSAGQSAAADSQESSRIAIAFAWPGEDARRGAACGANSALIENDPACFLSVDAMEMGSEIFVFDEDARLVEMRSVEAGGRLRFRADYADYLPLRTETAAEGATPPLFPNRVTIESPEAQSMARFEWKRVMLADDLSDQHFEIPERGGQPSGS